MNWLIEPTTATEHKIKQIGYVADPLNPNEYKITWHWPKGYDYVYVHTSVGEPAPLTTAADCRKGNVYSKEEYKKSQGCQNILELERGEKHIIQVFPVEVTGEEMRVFVSPYQEEEAVTVHSQRAKIQATITEKKRWFSKRKQIKLTLFSKEMDIDKASLCYVKKRNSRPVNKGDGYYFPLLHNIRKGQRKEYTITVKKKDSINVFLSDADTYGGQIELVRQHKG